MNAAEIEKTVKELICIQLDASPDDVKNDSSFEKDLKADSLDVIELVLALEDKFSIEISDEEVERLRTVGQAIECVKDKAVF